MDFSEKTPFPKDPFFRTRQNLSKIVSPTRIGFRRLSIFPCGPVVRVSGEIEKQKLSQAFWARNIYMSPKAPQWAGGSRLR